MQKNTMSAKDSKIAVALNPRVSLLVSVKKKIRIRFSKIVLLFSCSY